MKLGVIDWGIGGLGLVRELDEVAPGLPITYWSDAGVTPYGRLPSAALAARLRVVVDELVRRGCTHVALACNAASTVAARLADAPVPVDGIIPHGLAAVPSTMRGVVGVVGGRRTIRAGAYRRGLARAGRTVVSRVAQPLSAHIEAGRIGSAAFEADLARIVAPLRGARGLLLACTHYPAASAAFAAALPGTTLLDPAGTFAAALARALPSTGQGGERTFVTSGDARLMRTAARLAWGIDLGRVGKVAP